MTNRIYKWITFILHINQRGLWCCSFISERWTSRNRNLIFLIILMDVFSTPCCSFLPAKKLCFHCLAPLNWVFPLKTSEAFYYDQKMTKLVKISIIISHGLLYHLDGKLNSSHVCLGRKCQIIEGYFSYEHYISFDVKMTFWPCLSKSLVQTARNSTNNKKFRRSRWKNALSDDIENITKIWAAIFWIGWHQYVASPKLHFT